MSTRFAEVCQAERLIPTCETTLNGAKWSTSLQSVEFRAMPDGTALTLSEHLANLSGIETADDRRPGTKGLLDALVTFLTQ